MSEARSVPEAAGVQRENPLSLHRYNLCEGRDNRDAVTTEQIQDLDDLGDQSTTGVSVPQQVQLLCEKAVLGVPTTVFHTQKVVLQKLAAPPGRSVLFSPLKAWPDALKRWKELLQSKVSELKDQLASEQDIASTLKFVELRRTYDTVVRGLKDNLQKSGKRGDGVHVWTDSPSNSHKYEIEALQKANAVLRTDTIILTGNADSERVKLQQKLQKGNRNTALQTRTYARLSDVIQFLKTNADSTYFHVQMLPKVRNDAECVRDRGKKQETLLAAQNSMLAQPYSDVQKTVTTVNNSVPKYRTKFSSDINSGFREFFSSSSGFHF